MEKIIAAFEARRRFGRILQEVEHGGHLYVVERHGEPVAVVVPMHVYERWKALRQAFFDRMRATSEQADMAVDEAEALAAEAVHAARDGR